MKNNEKKWRKRIREKGKISEMKKELKKLKKNKKNEEKEWRKTGKIS